MAEYVITPRAVSYISDMERVLRYVSPRRKHRWPVLMFVAAEDMDQAAQTIKRALLTHGRATELVLVDADTDKNIPDSLVVLDGIQWAIRRGMFSADEIVAGGLQYQAWAERRSRGFVDDLREWCATYARSTGQATQDILTLYMERYVEQRGTANTNQGRLRHDHCA